MTAPSSGFATFSPKKGEKGKTRGGERNVSEILKLNVRKCLPSLSRLRERVPRQGRVRVT
jgi:hypothetical protein